MATGRSFGSWRTADPMDPTVPQLEYIDALAKGLHLPRRMLSDFCVREFGKPFAELDRRQASRLIDALKAWQENEREMRIAMGQAEMPGFGP